MGKNNALNDMFKLLLNILKEIKKSLGRLFYEPVHDTEAFEDFFKQMEENSKNKGTVDFSNEIKAKDEILRKGNFINYSADRWLSPIPSEREWQEKHIKKIFPSYPNSCPNWQILNKLIRMSCELNKIEINEPLK